jgi:hypothetical protein
MWATLQQNRQAGARMVLEHARRVGDLEPGLDMEWAVDVLWFWNDPAHHAALVGGRKWSAGEYRDWLSARMRESLLGGPRPSVAP